MILENLTVILEQHAILLKHLSDILEDRNFIRRNKNILELLKYIRTSTNYKKKILKLKLTHYGSIQYSVVIKKGENLMKGIIYSQQFTQLHLHTK